MADNKRPGEFIQLDTPSLKLGSKDPLYRIFEELNRALRQIWVRLSGTVGVVTGTSPIESSGGDTPVISLVSSAASRLFGRGDSSAGNAQEIDLGAGLTMTGTTLSASGSGGTVTAVTATAPLASSGGATPDISLTVPSDATKFLDGTGTFDTVKDSDLSTSNITTNNVTIAKHGFAPILPNDATKYLDGTGNYTVPAGTSTSSTYTPSHTNLTNLSSTTPRVTTYMQVGSMVFVAGEFTADPTAPAVATSFEMDLPVASNFANTFECGGSGAGDSQGGYSVRISGNVANNTALVSWVASDVSSQPINFDFGYRVI